MKAVIFRDLPEEKRISMENYADALATALREIVGDRWQIVEIQPHEVRWIRRMPFLPHAAKADNYYSRFIHYPWQVRRLQGDINHIIDHAYGHLLYTLDGRRSVVTCHDLVLLKCLRGELQIGRFSTIAAYMFRVSVAALQRAAHIITVSSSTKTDILNHIAVPECRITVIPYGVNRIFRKIEDLQVLNQFKARFSLNASFYVIHVGTKASYKNNSTLLRAIAFLRHNLGIDAELLKVGASFAPEDEVLIDGLGLRRHIVHLGYLSLEELVLPYNVAHVLAFPSLWEGFGWPPLEAMACGTPVVTSNTGSLPEVVGDAGLMVDPDDFEGLAHAIAEVLTRDELREVLVARGLKRARLFSWGRAARLTMEVYEQVFREVPRDNRHR